MLWLYLDFFQLSLDISSYQNEHAGSRVLVYEGDTKILQCNRHADQQGIRPGMSVGVAYSLDSDICVVNYDKKTVQQTLENLAQWAYGYSSQISLHQPDGLCLEIGSMLRLFGSLEDLWVRIKESLNNQGYRVNMAVAHTPLAVKALAKARKGYCHQDREVFRKQLKQLSLRQCGFPEWVCESCERMGLYQLVDLLLLPRADINCRFGQETIDYLSRLLGNSTDPQQYYMPPSVFFRRIEFLEEIVYSAGILFPLRRLLSELEELLNQRQQVIQKVQLNLMYRDCPDTTLVLALAKPEKKLSEILQICRLKFENFSLPKPIIGLSVSVNEFFPYEPDTDDFFSQRLQQQEQCDKLLARLKARLGDGSIRSIGLLDDHRPEKAWQWCSTHGSFNYRQSDDCSRSLELANQTDMPMTDTTRPAWCLLEVEAIEIDEWHITSGPERVVSGWWDDASARRDYYIAQHREGAWGWLYRQDDGQWFLQGWFG